jgi:hypothetical protein
MEQLPIILPKNRYMSKDGRPAYKYTLNPKELGNYLFIPSETFVGERPGYVYQKGISGNGYYLNRPPTPHPDQFIPPKNPLDPEKKLKTTIRYVPRDEIVEEFHPYVDFIDLPKLPDQEPPTDTLAIYMGCHGIRYSRIQRNIKDVTISKFNHAGYCAVNVGILSKKRTISCAQNLVYGWEYLPRPTQEEGLTSDFCNASPNNELDMENTCTNFYVNPPNGWLCKIYSSMADPQACLAVAYKDKVIDLLHCTIEELYDFVDIQDPSILYDLRIIIYDVPGKERVIYTQQIFHLIKLMKSKGISKVHMYDITCNMNDNTTQPENVGYGGKTKRKSKRRKSRKKNIK